MVGLLFMYLHITTRLIKKTKKKQEKFKAMRETLPLVVSDNLTLSAISYNEHRADRDDEPCLNQACVLMRCTWTDSF